MFLGYLEFMVLLFLPGLAFIEIFQLAGSFSFTERLGLAFGLSMALDVLVLAVRTSGVVIGGQALVGVYPGTLDLMIGVSLIALLAPVLVRRRLTFYIRPVRNDLYALGVVAAQVVLVVAHFYEYPVFPQFQSVDFVQHVEITQGLQSGLTTFLPGGILYYGAHMLMAAALALSGDIALVATQYAMGVLVVFSPLLLYLAVSSVSSSKRIALIASLLYVGTGSIWFGSIFNAGLYANFYGLLAMLLLLALVPVVLSRPKSPGVWVALGLSVANGYLSHYSFVTIIPALISLPIAFFLLEKKVSWPAVAIPAVVTLPALAAAVADPGLVGILIGFVQTAGGGNVQNDTYVSKAFAFWPVLRYVFVEITDDLSTFVTLGLALLGSYVAVKQKLTPAFWMVFVWLVAVLVVAPFTETAWRFSYIALLPLLIIAAIGIERLVPSPATRGSVQRSKLRARADYRRWQQGIVVLAMVCLVVGSWSWNAVGGAVTAGPSSDGIQHSILKSMVWMNTNLPTHSNIVSVTDSDYSYYQVLFNRPAGYAPLATPAEIADSVTAIGNGYPTYAILTTVGTVGLVNSSYNPFAEFSNNTEFKNVYNSSGVYIYQFVATG